MYKMGECPMCKAEGVEIIEYAVNYYDSEGLPIALGHESCIGCAKRQSHKPGQSIVVTKASLDAKAEAGWGNAKFMRGHTGFRG